MTDSRDLDERVLSWLSPEDHDPAPVSQNEAQELAWYTAPREWTVPGDELAEVAAACARLLETSDRPRAAAALREQTPSVLAGWKRSPEYGRVAYSRAMQDSGVQPPDTPTLAWGKVMGCDEATAFDAAARILESALDTGDFTPSGPDWRTTQRNLIEAWLRAPCTVFAGRAPVDVVHAERAAHWAEAGTAARCAILQPLLPRLAMPTHQADAVEPLRFLLDAIGDGLTLTTAGRLPPDLVQDVAARFGWGLEAFTVHRENHVVELSEIRDLATRARLTRIRRRQLNLTDAGRAALDDPARRWAAATAAWFDYDEFAAHIAEVAAALLLDRPATTDALTSTAHDAVAPSFVDLDGAHPNELDVRTALWEWLRPGQVLGWLTYPHDAAERLYQLTEPGRAAALDGLRHRCHARA
ncbi:MAG: hypothetical protein ACRDRZ_18865 [Pseudonocardiaceae bacterium]